MKTTRSILRDPRPQVFNLGPETEHTRRAGVIELTDKEYEDFVASKKRYENWQQRLVEALDATDD